jgi:Flp pilus assembly pilin Flp
MLRKVTDTPTTSAIGGTTHGRRVNAVNHGRILGAFISVTIASGISNTRVKTIVNTASSAEVLAADHIAGSVDAAMIGSIDQPFNHVSPVSSATGTD